jgi:hypothetical protein
MWIRRDDKGWFLDLILGDIWIGTNIIWRFLDQIKTYVDCKVCDMKLSRPIRCTMCIRTDDTGWGFDLIWGVLSLEKLWTYAVMNKYEVLCGLYVEEKFQDQFELLCRWYVDRNRWYRMLSWTNIKCNVDWNIRERKLSRPILSTMWIRKYDRGWCHDLIWGAL